MSNLILGLKNKKTNEKIDLDISKEFPFDADAFVPTSFGLYFLQSNGDFIDILEATNVQRRENDSWVYYYIDTYTYDNRKFRYKRSRNLYNKKDKPIAVEVGECNNDCW